MKGEINLTISAININSFNVSTLGGDSNKILLKYCRRDNIKKERYNFNCRYQNGPKGKRTRKNDANYKKR